MKVITGMKLIRFGNFGSYAHNVETLKRKCRSWGSSLQFSNCKYSERKMTFR